MEAQLPKQAFISRVAEDEQKPSAQKNGGKDLSLSGMANNHSSIDHLDSPKSIGKFASNLPSEGVRSNTGDNTNLAVRTSRARKSRKQDVRKLVRGLITVRNDVRSKDSRIKYATHLHRTPRVKSPQNFRSEVNNIIAKCDSNKNAVPGSPHENRLRTSLEKMNRINRHFDEVYGIIENLNAGAPDALENMFLFKKQEINENHRDIQKIVQEYRKVCRGLDPSVMKLELRKAHFRKLN